MYKEGLAVYSPGLVVPKEQRKYVLTRGFSSPSTEHAVRLRLNVNNPSSRSSTDGFVPGLFFSGGERSITSAEGWAVMVGKREEKIPHTMKITVEIGNFDAIAGRVYLLKYSTGSDLRSGTRYVPVYSFQDMQEGGAVVNIGLLSYADLVALNCMVGAGQKVGEFEYTTYKELTEKYLGRSL